MRSPAAYYITLLLLQATSGIGLPSTLVTRPGREWLPRDNQTMYTLAPEEIRRLELNTSSISDALVYITVSPCTEDVIWSIHSGEAGCSDGRLKLIKEYRGSQVRTFSAIVSRYERYILKLISLEGGAAAVSVRGEKPKRSRLRLRFRSKRRLSANWEPSSIDPQATSYCVVASNKKNYTSLCAAKLDSQRQRSDQTRLEADSERRASGHRQSILFTGNYSGHEMDNKIQSGIEMFGYDLDVMGIYRRKKISRSTKVSKGDPQIACVGDRTHHLIEYLNLTSTYFVSVFGVGSDRQSGTLLAADSLRPHTIVARRLTDSVAMKTAVKGRSVFYYKGIIGPRSGLWLLLAVCGGAIDVEVSVRGKILYADKNIDSFKQIYVPASAAVNQENSGESSIQYDSSSEEARIRYGIRISPSGRERTGVINLELTASSSRWLAGYPELSPEDGASVRELRPKRTCRSVEVAFLPTIQRTIDTIRYCIVAREITKEENYKSCQYGKKASGKTICMNISRKKTPKVVFQKVSGLKPGRKYAVQVTASSKGNSIPYKLLYVDTNPTCK